MLSYYMGDYMKLNKRIFLISLILLILIVPQSISADNMDLTDANGFGDNSNLKLNVIGPSDQNIGGFNSINEIGDIEDGISSDKLGANLGESSNEYSTQNLGSDLDIKSSVSSALDDESYLVSDNNKSLGYESSEELIDDDSIEKYRQRII